MARTKLTRRERDRRAAAALASGARPNPAEQAGQGTVEHPVPPMRSAAPLRRLNRQHAIAALVLGLLVVTSYFPAMLGGFVWDDAVFAQEEVIRSASGLQQIWFSPGDIKGEGHYWPLVYTSFWLEHKLWGFEPFGYHLVNVLLHLVNCLLLWRLMLLLAVPGAWLIAAVFAVHPLHVESVAWVIERKDLLSALFFLAAAMAWMRFDESRSRGRYLQSLGLFAAAMLSKSIAVTLPASLLIWQWWKRGRAAWSDVLRLAPFFALAACITAADVAFYQGREAVALGYTLVERALIAARALWFYAAKLMWPTELAVIYPHWEVDSGSLVSWSFLAAAAALALALWLCRGRIGTGPLAGMAFFAVTLSPVLGFVDFGYMQFSFVADRYQYLAGIGVTAVVVGAACHYGGKLGGMRMKAAQGVAAVTLVLLGTLTWRQAGIYRDGITFFSHIVALNPQARDAHLNLAAALTDADRAEEGLAAALTAAEQRPELAKAHSNVGRALIKLGRLDDADGHLRRALELDPRDRTGLQNAAEALRLRKQYEAAVGAYRDVLRIDADFALAHVGLGNALLELGRYEEAIESIARAAALRPGPELERSLDGFMGLASLRLGRLDQAERHLQRAVESDPGNPSLLVEFSNLRRAQQRLVESSEYLRRARELQPDSPATLQNVAEALRKQERYEEAIESYRAVLRIDPEYALAHAGLGESLFRLERYEMALEAMSEAVALRPGGRVEGSMHRLLGRTSRQLGRLDRAEQHFRRAIEIESNDTDAIDRLARLMFERKDYEQARRLYAELSEKRPHDAQAHSNLAASLYYLGRTDEALLGFERALSLDPNLETARSAIKNLRPGAP